jgi:phosphoglycerate dehydrogenase-like enzyme
VVDEESLYHALENRIIQGAAIDVWYEYRPDEDLKGRKYPYQFPFHTLDKVVLSPHRGASPFDDLKRWDEVIENIRRFSEGRRDFLNVVDLDREY